MDGLITVAMGVPLRDLKDETKVILQKVYLYGR